MSELLIIASGDYVGQELVAEFGLLPPSFLPLANRRLFEHQADLAVGRELRTVMSLPEGFEPLPADRKRLQELKIEAISVPEGLRLADSILYVLNMAGRVSGPVRLLHGDTLIRPLPEGRDIVSVAATNTFYPWAEYDADAEGGARFHDGLWRHKDLPIVSGYFCFSSPELLAQSLVRARGDFIRALNIYAATSPLAGSSTREWFDFGHVQTYYNSRAQFVIPRAFNAMSSRGHTIRKHSTNTAKLVAEVAWFEGLPRPLRRFAPALLDAGPTEDEQYGYELEFLRLATLSDLYCFGHLPPPVWESVFDACEEWLTACARYPGPDDLRGKLAALYLPKTLRRLDEFARSSGFDVDRELVCDGVAAPGLTTIARMTAQVIAAPDAAHLTVSHGDFCFSNILYDHRSGCIKLIDPRGGAGVFGDLRYDVAKLYHSVIGCYDLILSGRFDLVAEANAFGIRFPDEERLGEIQAIFRERTFAGRIATADRAVHAICIHLFLSMLPLHSDDPRRQMAFVANALRLFQQWQAT
jgi:hypothetical protein